VIRSASRPSESPPQASGRRALPLGLDRFELLVLAAFAALSLAVLAALLTKGRALTGADGVLASDQLQYFTWIREASEHGLIGNRYDFAPDDHAFLHPGFLISGVLHAVTGVSVPLSYLLWKPVAVALTFVGALLYARRLLPARGTQRVALVLILFAVMPASALVAWTNWGGNARQYTFDFISGEMWTGQYLWGYLMTALAVALMPLVLLGVERWRRERRTRTLVLSALGGLVVCWLQPWQGATLALIVALTELIASRRARTRPAAAVFAVPAAIAVPSLYYWALSHWDAAWELAADSNAAGSQATWSWPWWAIALTLAPLALPAALAYRERVRDWQEVAVRVWPFAALIVYLLPFGTFPYHSFQGLAIPLSILAVQGVRLVWPRPRLAIVVGALVVMTLPGIAHKLEVAVNSVRAAGDPYFVFPGEQAAMDALERDPRPGGVLAPAYGGHMLPYKTGREVYVGALSWTPDWEQRVADTQRLFEGTPSGPWTRSFVRRTGARFIFVDCRPGLRDLAPILRPLLEDVRRFDCATLYVLRRHAGTALVGD
jgi:hypothetical protein